MSIRRWLPTYPSTALDFYTNDSNIAVANEMSMPLGVAIEDPAAIGKTLSEINLTNEVATGSESSLANDTQNGSATDAEAQTEGEGPSIAAKNGADDSDDESDIGPAIYPPILESMEVLGYIKDKNGIGYSRDIGRSNIIHDEVYFIFGDTFCKNSAGDFVGITSNTTAYVENRAKCLESEYMEISDKGMVKAFVPFDEKELRFEKDNESVRLVFRMYGGAVDVGAVGVVWFQELIEHDDGKVDYRGIGQARLSTYSNGRIIVQRLKSLLFGPNEPRIGSFSTLRHDDHVYLWSDQDGQIILARVDHLETAFPHRYEYWSGNDWVPRWQDAQPVLHDVQHGAIIHTEMFGKDKPFLFVGVNNQGDSMVQIGAAAEVQGPFNLMAICKATGIDHDEKYKYCIYPHLFASNVPKRELIVTWSEHWPGGVIAAKLKFKIDEVAAVKEAEERRRAAQEEEARRLARIAEVRHFSGVLSSHPLFFPEIQCHADSEICAGTGGEGSAWV